MKRKEQKKLLKFTVFALVVIVAFLASNFFDLDYNIVENVEKDSLKTEENNVLSAEQVEDKLQVHFVDVGQADAIFIKQGEHYMVIDAGKNDTKEFFVNYLKSQGVEKLDYVIGTHAHEDHIGGMAEVIKNFEVDNILFPKQTATTKTFENFVLAVKKKNKQLYSPNVSDTFQFGEASFQVLAPNESKYDDANNYSIVIKLTYKENTFLFTGDAEALSEKEILDKGFDIKCDVLKVAHHGSYSSTSEEFLDKVSPKIAVISVGKDNSYNHPSKTTMQKFEERGITVYRTDESGTIILNSDGKNISSNVSPGTYSYKE